MKNIKIVLSLLAMVLIAAGCSFKYRLNGASMKVKFGKRRLELTSILRLKRS